MNFSLSLRANRQWRYHTPRAIKFESDNSEILLMPRSMFPELEIWP